MGADDTYAESMVVVIEFNRIGEVTHTKTF